MPKLLRRRRLWIHMMIRPLGPGADPQHETHLHLDMLMHAGTANYHICE
jgi:hypothetical protein